MYTDAEIMAALVKSGGLVYVAARAVGCDPDTIYNRARARPNVAACVKHQRGAFVDLAEQSLRKAVKKCEPWAVALVLKTLGKDRGYCEKDDRPPDDKSPGVPVELVTRLFALLGARQPDAGGVGIAPPGGAVGAEPGGAVAGVPEHRG